MLFTNFFIHGDLETNEILSNTDERFYKFIQTSLGSIHARILQCQHINSVPCFILAEDPCNILLLDMDDPELEQLTKEVCFRSKNNQLIVRTGISNSFKCFRETLIKKTEEYLKLLNSKKTKRSKMNITIDSGSTQSLTPLQGDDLQGSINCTCGTRINLGKNGFKFQLSNFYKHLKDSKCTNINEIKKKNEERSQPRQTISLNQILTTSTSVSASASTDSSINRTSTSSSNANNKREQQYESFQKLKKHKKNLHV